MVKTLGTYGNGCGEREKQKQLTLTWNKVTLSVLNIFEPGLLHRLEVQKKTITK